MSRPRKVDRITEADLAAVRRRAVPPPRDPGPPVAPTDLPTLYPIDSPALDATPFGAVASRKTRWKLIREGKIKAVRIGRRVYLTEEAIREFIARGGTS